MYFVLGIEKFFDQEYEEFTHFPVDPANDELEEWPWLHGETFTEKPKEPLAFKVGEDDLAGCFADYIEHPIPLVSEVFLKVLTSCKLSNIEYYKTTIAGSNDYDNFPAYYALNIIGTVHAKAKKEKKMLNSEGASILEGIQMTEDDAQGLDIFRLANFLPAIVVSEKVKAAYDASGLDTVRFTPIEQWSN